jgi:hypothetical protein
MPLDPISKLPDDDLKQEYLSLREETAEHRQLYGATSAWNQHHLQQLKLEMQRRGLSVEV